MLAMIAVSYELVPAVIAGPLAHHGADPDQWSTAPLLAVLASLAAGYGRGVHELWSRRGVGRVVSRRRVVAFGAGVAVLVLCQSPSGQAMAERSLAGHMCQHMLLLVVAAPLLGAGSAGLALLMATPLPVRRRLARWRASRPVRWLRRPVRLALVAAAVHTAALWVWHLPKPYLGALHHEPLHAAEHASFVAAGWLLWSTLLGLPRPRTPSPTRVAGLGGPPGFLLLFGTGMLAAALGAVLTLAPAPIYRAEAYAPSRSGPLPDQQLAGLVMWIPMEAIVLLAAAAMLLRWLARLEGAAPADRDRQPDDRPLADQRLGGDSTQDRQPADRLLVDRQPDDRQPGGQSPDDRQPPRGRDRSRPAWTREVSG